MDPASTLHRIRVPLVLGVLLLMVLLGTVWAWNQLFAGTSETPTTATEGEGEESGEEGDGEGSPDAPACVVQPMEDGRVRPSMVTVTVQNAGSTAGLAGEVADDLEDFNFTVADVGNAEDVSVESVMVVGFAEDAPEVELVAGQFEDVEVRGDDTMTDHNVHVIVGDEYDGRVDDAPGIVQTDLTEICLPALPDASPSAEPEE